MFLYTSVTSRDTSNRAFVLNASYIYSNYVNAKEMQPIDVYVLHFSKMLD